MSLLSSFNPTVGQCLMPSRVKSSQVGSSNAISINNHSAPTHQLRAKEERFDLKESSAMVSRRKMMGLAGLSLAMFSLSSPEPAEARMTRAEMKNKILEKFRELREKFGVSKPGDDDKEQISEPGKDSEAQQEYSGEQKMFAYPGDEGKEATHKAEGEYGKNSVIQTENASSEESTPQKDKSPFLPFLDLTEVDLEPLVEANVSQ
ncbi:hypothetical protein LIER_14776 [Lithospermum erythrorhizon]|uniref:Uncharacterized protein n=1 Tax=Lithospermum erythrorhizon TaxID=34254 RepID=A0AAV3Q1B8_LITER